MIYETMSPKETFELGRKIGLEAKAGEIICLDGDLGVGKTVFTQGFAKGLGIDEAVNSPTFTIIQEYDEGRLPLYHFDVYRIGNPGLCLSYPHVLPLTSLQQWIICRFHSLNPILHHRLLYTL